MDTANGGITLPVNQNTGSGSGGGGGSAIGAIVGGVVGGVVAAIFLLLCVSCCSHLSTDQLPDRLAPWVVSVACVVCLPKRWWHPGSCVRGGNLLGVWMPGMHPA